MSSNLFNRSLRGFGNTCRWDRIKQKTCTNTRINAFGELILIILNIAALQQQNLNKAGQIGVVARSLIEDSCFLHNCRIHSYTISY